MFSRRTCGPGGGRRSVRAQRGGGGRDRGGARRAGGGRCAALRAARRAPHRGRVALPRAALAGAVGIVGVLGLARAVAAALLGGAAGRPRLRHRCFPPLPLARAGQVWREGAVWTSPLVPRDVWVWGPRRAGRALAAAPRRRGFGAAAAQAACWAPTARNRRGAACKPCAGGARRPGESSAGAARAGAAPGSPGGGGGGGRRGGGRARTRAQSLAAPPAHKAVAGGVKRDHGGGGGRPRPGQSILAPRELSGLRGALKDPNAKCLRRPLPRPPPARPGHSSRTPGSATQHGRTLRRGDVLDLPGRRRGGRAAADAVQVPAPRAPRVHGALAAAAGGKRVRRSPRRAPPPPPPPPRAAAAAGVGWPLLGRPAFFGAARPRAAARPRRRRRPAATRGPSRRSTAGRRRRRRGAPAAAGGRAAGAQPLGGAACGGGRARPEPARAPYRRRPRPPRPAHANLVALHASPPGCRRRGGRAGAGRRGAAGPPGRSGPHASQPSTFVAFSSSHRGRRRRRLPGAAAGVSHSLTTLSLCCRCRPSSSLRPPSLPPKC